MSNERIIHGESVTPMQFGTRALLIAVAAFAVLFVIVQALGAVWGTLFLWFLLLIAGHIAGNFHGTRLRQDAEEAITADPAASYARPLVLAVRYAPATRLRDNKGFGRVRAILTGVCAVLGCVLGTTALLLVTRTGVGGVVLGGLSAGILGGFLGFICGSFLMVATGAFREAADDSSARVIPRGNHAA